MIVWLPVTFPVSFPLIFDWFFIVVIAAVCFHCCYILSLHFIASFCMYTIMELLHPIWIPMRRFFVCVPYYSTMGMPILFTILSPSLFLLLFLFWFFYSFLSIEPLSPFSSSKWSVFHDVIQTLSELLNEFYSRFFILSSLDSLSGSMFWIDGKPTKHAPFLYHRKLWFFLCWYLDFPVGRRSFPVFGSCLLIRPKVDVRPVSDC